MFNPGAQRMPMMLPPQMPMRDPSASGGIMPPGGGGAFRMNHMAAGDPANAQLAQALMQRRPTPKMPQVQPPPMNTMPYFGNPTQA